MKDFYYILGVDANCTLTEIKEAYWKLSKKFHPDANHSDDYFDSHFREINEAYETLSDPAKRILYNSALELSRPHEQIFSNYNAHTGRQRKYRARPAAFYVSRIKGPGIGMSVTLILIALIAGIYLVESFINKKPRPAVPLAAVGSVTAKSHHHRKKKHSLKNKPYTGFAKVKPDTSYKKYVSPKPVVEAQPIIVESSASLPLVHDKSVGSVQPSAVKNDFLYVAYIRPNITGVVNMRESDNYGSPIIKVIPANSKVLVLEKGTAYYRVAFDNYKGYVPKSFLQTK